MRAKLTTSATFEVSGVIALSPKPIHWMIQV
jgi:hypothetical protein